MNKRVLVALIAIVAVVGVVFGAYALTRAPAAVTPIASKPTAVVSDSPSPSPAAPTAGSYIDYSTAQVPAESGRTFLFFYASWCGQCHEIDGDILALGVPSGVTIVKVNWDTEQAAEQHYGVAMRTTFVEVDQYGAEVQKFVAYDTPTFAAVRAAMHF